MRRSRLVSDSLLNLAGSGIPIIVSLPLLGILARLLHPERFGLILLAWALVGYAGILDLGLSRAVTVAVATSHDNVAVRKHVLTTAFALSLVIGAAFTALFWALSGPITQLLLKGDSVLSAETIIGFRVVGVMVSLLLPYLILQGYWEGVENFRNANKMRIASGSLPLLFATGAAAWEPSFSSAMIGALCGRALALIFSLSLIGIGELRRGVPDRNIANRLFRLGGWVTVSSVISPAMSYLDRFIVGFSRGPVISGFYAAPVDIAIKLLLLSQSITRSLLPKLLAASDQKTWDDLTSHANKLVALVCVPVAITGVLFGGPILHLWLGKVYEEQATGTLRIIMVGFLLCSMAQVPFTEIYGRKRFSSAAVVQALQVLPAIALTYWMSKSWGAEGAALAWTLRAGSDLLVYSVIARRMSRTRQGLFRQDDFTRVVSSRS